MDFTTMKKAPSQNFLDYNIFSLAVCHELYSIMIVCTALSAGGEEGWVSY